MGLNGLKHNDSPRIDDISRNIILRLLVGNTEAIHVVREIIDEKVDGKILIGRGMND